MSLQLPPGTCPKCFWCDENPELAGAYCPRCGSYLIASEETGIGIICHKCGQWTYVHGKFCTRCGRDCLKCDDRECWKWSAPNPYLPLRDEKEKKEAEKPPWEEWKARIKEMGEQA